MTNGVRNCPRPSRYMLAEYHELEPLHAYLEPVPFISSPPHRIYVGIVPIQVAGMLEQYH